MVSSYSRGGGEDLEGIVGGKTIIRIYYMKNLPSIKESQKRKDSMYEVKKVLFSNKLAIETA